MRALSDADLRAETARLKRKLAAGASLASLMPEAYAAVAEADRRMLGFYPFDEQIYGAVALEAGCLAEMNTGEGKTLTATMPLYLHALTGKSTILVTANEYLASRDADQLRPVFSLLGLTERAGVAKTPGRTFTNDEKRVNYAADVLYTTHSALAFDYLLNNLVARAEDRFLRDFDFVLVDEADSVLLDSAQMPLVISGSPRVQSNLYASADFFVSTLKEDRDFEVEDKSVWLTEAGVARAERFFGIDSLFAHKNFRAQPPHPAGPAGAGALPRAEGVHGFRRGRDRPARQQHRPQPAGHEAARGRASGAREEHLKITQNSAPSPRSPTRTSSSCSPRCAA